MLNTYHGDATNRVIGRSGDPVIRKANIHSVDHQIPRSFDGSMITRSPDHPITRSSTVATFWKGRVALYAILKALGIGAGDTVLVAGFTCFVVPLAVRFAQAEPAYVDIDPATFNITRAAIASARTPRTKAVIVQHTYGIPADCAAIIEWGRQENIAVIEDCAHVLGSRYRDAWGNWCPVGSMGDVAFFSSQWTKPVSTGLGGWVCTSDPALAAKVRQFHQQECAAPSWMESGLLATQVFVRELLSAPSLSCMAKNIYQKLYRRGLLIGTSSPEEFAGKMPPGYAKRMSGFQQWLLHRRLADSRVELHRRWLKTFYDDALRATGLPAVQVPNYADPVLVRYPVRVSGKSRLLQEARRRSIELGDWYRQPVDPPGDALGDAFGYRSGMCPEGERAGREVVNLPMHLGIDKDKAAVAVKLVKEYA
jgi:dTDP-4-amino-4,6-dideoxygalactose transaminase